MCAIDKSFSGKGDMNKDPQIKKAKYIYGNHLKFKGVDVNDSAFIVALRTDAKKGMHLSSTSSDDEQQRRWIEDYKKNTSQAYFIIQNEQDESIGTVRLYDPQLDSFCWGSWIIKDGAPAYAAIESALIVYAYALDFLEFKKAHFEVRIENEKVWKFHERFGAKRVRVAEHDYYYEINEKAIIDSRKRYMKYLPNKLKVEW